jgi:hypothetical protein
MSGALTPLARIEALTGLIPHLAGDEKSVVISQALDAASATTDDRRTEALIFVIPHLTGYKKSAVISQAMTAVHAITDPLSRARAYTLLAGCLPADQQPAVITQALTAVSTITDDSRAGTLTLLSPCLSADHLADAIKMAPRGSADPLMTLMERAKSVLAPGDEATLLSLLRSAFDGSGRRACFGIIQAAAPLIARIGGTAAIQECVKAIEDVHQWWP